MSVEVKGGSAGWDWMLGFKDPLSATLGQTTSLALSFYPSPPFFLISPTCGGFSEPTKGPTTSHKVPLHYPANPPSLCSLSNIVSSEIGQSPPYPHPPRARSPPFTRTHTPPPS